MIKLLSYLMPITTDSIQSEFSGVLDITWHRGKKTLNTEKSNYSYGVLQEILEFGLTKIDFHPVSNILILGLGGGSIVHSLRKKHHHKGNITAIEIDDTIIDIAKNIYHLKNDTKLEIISADALRYVRDCSEIFDLLIIDLFIDDIIPDEFTTLKFWKDLTVLIQPNGQIIFNASMYENETKFLNLFEHEIFRTWEIKTFKKVKGHNTLYVFKYRNS